MADGEVWVTFSSIEDAAAQTGVTSRTVQALLDDLYTVLGHISTLLSETNETYIEAESSVTQLWE